jgi:hypothetical protein
MIKLIVSDVDGTIVPDGSDKVNPEYFEVIRKLREKGMQVVIASGRPWPSIEAAFEPVKEKIFYIADNGAYIGCHGRSLYEYAIDKELVRRIIEKSRLHKDLDMIYATANGDYLDSDNEYLYKWLVEGYKFQVTRVDDIAKVEVPCIKLSFYKDSNIEEATRDIYEDFKDEVNKGKAVQTIQESLGILPEETMAFGDQLNDIEMLGRAYYSFAVANAREEVRKAARFQADSNENDGVLKVLKTLL